MKGRAPSNGSGPLGGPRPYEEFIEFVDKHRELCPVVEDNDLMAESYVMIDAAGRFFQNTHGIYKYSDRILDVGIWKALWQVGFSWKKLVRRGGCDYFKNEGTDTKHVFQPLQVGG